MKKNLVPTVGAFVLAIFCIASFSLADEFSIDSIKNISKKCSRYRLKRGVNDLSDFYRNYGAGWKDYIWDVGAYMSGVMAAYRFTGEKWMLDSIVHWANNVNWTPSGGAGARDNSECPLQVFVEVYLLDKNSANLNKMVKPSLDNVRSLLGNGPTSWGLVDWLYMSPTAVPRVYEAYKDVPGSNVAQLLDNLGASWKRTAANLLSSRDKLWWRDGNYKNAKTANGSPVFWSGGDAWAIAGLARILQYMPADQKDMPDLIQEFKDVCEALRKCPALGSDGMWRTSLLDYNQFPIKESISSAFFGFCFAWGINNKLLDRTTYEPYVRKTWSALVNCIGADGRLQWCQGVTEKPGNDITQSNSAPEGEGAFLLMAEELIKMMNSTSVIALTPVYPERRERVRLISRNGKLSVYDPASILSPIEFVDLHGRIALRSGPAGAVALPAGFFAAKRGERKLYSAGIR